MNLAIKDKNIKLPVFFPDATHGVIKGLDTIDINNTFTDGLVVNALHLLIDNKIDHLSQNGGIHNFMGYEGPIISDSGGFQAMSLVRRRNNGKLDDNGVFFKLPTNGQKIILTPESCIEAQYKIGSDIIMCLDDCTDPSESDEEQNTSVKRTIAWAKRCKEKYLELTDGMKEKPLIFGIVQGGNNKLLREKCANDLVKLGFDGYAYGGWPVQNNVFIGEIVEFTSELMPDDKPKYAMGVGKPEDIIVSCKYGYDMFDCVLPTRDARHKRLYRFTNDLPDFNNNNFYEYVHISNAKYINSKEPIEKNCDCHTCKNFSFGYLNHLFRIKEQSVYRLATIHNLRFYSRMMSYLRDQSLFPTI
jgi:queuine tRNA-ribosyltransferase